MEQLTGLSGEVVQHSNVVKSFSSYTARQHADQPASRCAPPRHTIAALAFFGHGAMFDLSSLCRPRRTSADHSKFMGSRPGERSGRPPTKEVAARSWASPRADDIGLISLRAQPNLLSRIKLMLPVQSPFAKIFCFSEYPSHPIFLPVPPHRGAYRGRHGRGAGCGGRGSVG